MNGDSLTYLESFGVKYILKEIKKNHRKNKNVIINIYKIQQYNSTISGYFCIGFSDFKLKSKSSLDYTNLFFF